MPASGPTPKGRAFAASFVIAERLLRCRSRDDRAREGRMTIIQRYPGTGFVNLEMPNVG
jgi:hypothetical protein